ncbi:MazG nucleotide pyrophosphohydrolase domain-containing protein [Psychromonas sp. 14N.309.X.WAT.B.A12]|jgi:NTP pyrophosphatase (non-canonical NTP hydrolase)|uniref:MazG nucleotide pyrophosphohydrolase domain-containing protein n=1 Tax=unclassified Psychromonas TaxID=2614957 RepID=UPI0025B14591|nr:MazG nucleotide pyrophosphohydrolase domain-containing protein [Psychromonas sp. 14N.309.X.WAT.B.A12]MDN2661967.1 hypothetical protein [Psychromonas sp. 14N.309.X.WAT.B.A12]
MQEFDKLMAIAKRKALLDEHSQWANGAETYLTEIKNEVDEVIEEMPKNRQCFLEDELGDVLWDYLNVLTALQKEMGINPTAVLKRACDKYEQRVSGLEAGKTWTDIKEEQKQALQKEFCSNR